MYIKDITCISPQPSFSGDFPASGEVVNSGIQYMALEPDYMGSIPLGQLRRMGRAVRMATGAAMPLLQKWPVDGIVLGTTDGGMGDCHRFLDQIIDFNEGTLTPTNFVNGAPGAPSGGLALMARNSGYNNTHSNKGLSFENVITDAMLLFNEGAVNSLLIGCVEEISQAHFNIERIAGFIKDEAGPATELLKSGTAGTVNGEGAAMFVVDTNPTNALAQIADTATYTGHQPSDLMEVISAMLSRNGLTPSDLDVLMLGRNGDVRSDGWYNQMAGAFPASTEINFKLLFGESPSAPAFATWYAAKAMSGAPMAPSELTKPWPGGAKVVLVYNHFQAMQHGLVLLTRAEK